MISAIPEVVLSVVIGAVFVTMLFLLERLTHRYKDPSDDEEDDE